MVAGSEPARTSSYEELSAPSGCQPAGCKPPRWCGYLIKAFSKKAPAAHDFRFSMRNPVVFDEFNDFGLAGGPAQLTPREGFSLDTYPGLTYWELFHWTYSEGFIQRNARNLWKTFFLKGFFRKFGPGLRSVAEILIKA